MDVGQLPLHLLLDDEISFENFFIQKENQNLVSQLKMFLETNQGGSFYLWGGASTGVSHLCQASCQYYLAKDLPVFYFSCRDAHRYDPGILQGCENLSFVCIDHVDQIEGLYSWQEALFHCYNRCDEGATPMLWGSHISPRQLCLELKDLRSRLSMSLIFQLPDLSDEQKIDIFIQRALLRGLEISSDVAQYLLHHHSRDLADLMACLEQVDQASWVQKRKITIPFLKNVLNTKK